MEILESRDLSGELRVDRRERRDDIDDSREWSDESERRERRDKSGKTIVERQEMLARREERGMRVEL